MTRTDDDVPRSAGFGFLLGPLLFGALAAAIGALVFREAQRTIAPAQPIMDGPLLLPLVFTAVLGALLFLTFAALQRRGRVLRARHAMEREQAVFVRMAADTIRTPLTGLRWLTELLRSGEFGAVSDSQRESMESMESAIRRVINLTNELLDVMKLSGGLVQYRPRPADLETILKQTVQDLGSLAAAKRQHPGFGQIFRDMPVWLDEPLIRHLLGTLLGAASYLAAVDSTVVLHAEPLRNEIAVGITYTGEKMQFKSMAASEDDIPLSTLPINTGDLNFMMSWEILAAAGGRFWVREKAPEYTLFISLPQPWSAVGAVDATAEEPAV